MSLVIKSSWDTGYGEGKNHEVGQTLQDFQRRTSLANAFMWTVCRGGLIVSLSLPFKICLFKVTMMSLNISQALLPFCVRFRFQDCCHCVCHSPLQATRDVHLNAGRPRSGPQARGGQRALCVPWRGQLCEGRRFTHAHLLSPDSDAIFLQCGAKPIKIVQYPTPKEYLIC